MNSASGMEPWSAFAAGAHADCAGGFFLVAEDEDVRHLLVGEVADLGVHLFVARVGFDAEAGGFELGFDFGCVGGVLLADGHQADLHGREPEREGAGVVLDEDAEKSLDRAEERAVDHDGLMALAVFADIFELKARGRLKSN